MIVRMADVGDVAALAELQGIAPERRAAFTDWMRAHAETHLPFVAESGGRVIGAAWLFIGERVPRDDAMVRHHGDVQSVMVRAEHRGQGAGSALMAAVLAEARSRALSHVTVHSGRRAVDFYLRNGFRHDRQLLIREPADP